MRASLAALAMLVAGLAAGCLPDLPLAQQIEDTRVIAARLEVMGAPERAWPAPGESARVTWLVVDPTDAAPVGWGLFACPAIIAPNGQRFCAGEPFGIALQEEPVDADPIVDFTVPPESELAGLTALVVQGVVCPTGTPVIDLSVPDVRCEGSDEPRQFVEYGVAIARPDIAPNVNPTEPTTALLFDDADWPAPAAEPPDTGCASIAGTPELPLRAVTDVAPVITVTGDQADRETYTTSSGDMVREDLVFAHYATLGEPSRQFTVIDDAIASDSFEWTLPLAEDVVAEGTLARFWLTVIDERGGTAWTTRYACVTP